SMPIGNVTDICHEVSISACEDHRARRIKPLLQFASRNPSRKYRPNGVVEFGPCLGGIRLAEPGLLQVFLLLQGHVEDVAEQIICASSACVGIGKVPGRGPAHRRYVNEVETLSALNG